MLEYFLHLIIPIINTVLRYSKHGHVNPSRNTNEWHKNDFEGVAIKIRTSNKKIEHKILSKCEISNFQKFSVNFRVFKIS